jgi:hypothetical protein
MREEGMLARESTVLQIKILGEYAVRKKDEGSEMIGGRSNVR